MQAADVSSEEFEETHRCAAAGGGGERWQLGRADRDELVIVLLLPVPFWQLALPLRPDIYRSVR
jgi:hypothetical protein